MLKRVIEHPGKKALLVLPYVALVQEETKWHRRVADGVDNLHDDQEISAPPQLSWNIPNDGLRVASFFGGNRTQITWANCDIAVCTIEKANMLLNAAIEEGKVDELGVVVFDELHTLDDEHRGYIMELMINKLLFIQTDVQIVGISATLSNPKLLADWFEAKFYVSNFRPIPVEEHLVYDNLIYPAGSSNDFLRTASQLVRPPSTPKPPHPGYSIAESTHKELSKPMTNATVALAIETVVAGYGALIFCNSRSRTQSLASLLSDAVPSNCNTVEMSNHKADVLATLQTLLGGYDPLFAKTIMAGVAFHHAGLTVEERDLVAEAYDMGTLKIIVATCSLAASINLPARRVILHGARMGRELVGPAMLRQMRGRAGRKGKDEIGETFLCCQKEDLESVAEILEAELPAVASSLTAEKRGLKRAVLEALTTRVASSHESLHEYVTRSLLWQTTEHSFVLEMLASALTSLLDDQLIEAISDRIYAPTRLGSAIVASGFTPEDGLFIQSDLRKALSSLVLDTELHIFYLFTPIPQLSPALPVTSDISWPVFRTLLDTLDKASLRALQLIGISGALINKMAQSGLSDLKETTPEEIKKARIYRRAYSAFALRDICNEIPIHTISLKYNLQRGQIQTLAQTCHGFAAGIIKFCQRMAAPFASSIGTDDDFQQRTNPSVTLDPSSAGFSMLSAVLSQMSDRLQAGARSDLLEMAQVTFVKGRMARLLYDNGFKGVRALAEADPQRDILPVMMQVSGWKTRVRHGETEVEWSERKQRVEEKILTKCEVLVRSAGRVWEAMCLKFVGDGEE